MDEAKLDELARSIRGQRRHSTDRGARRGAAIAIRSSPANAAGAPRSAPVFRGPRRRHATSPPDERTARDGAHREHPARRPQPDRRGAAYQRLVDEFHLTQDEIAAAVGKDRATVANYLRLLKLPDEVRGNVASGALSMGHARALVALGSEDDQTRLAAGRGGARLVGAGNGSAREARLDKAQPGRVARRPRRKTCTPAPPKKAALVARHARRDQAAREGRHASQSSLRTKTSCSDSTST